MALGYIFHTENLIPTKKSETITIEISEMVDYSVKIFHLIIYLFFVSSALKIEPN